MRGAKVEGLQVELCCCESGRHLRRSTPRTTPPHTQAGEREEREEGKGRYINIHRYFSRMCITYITRFLPSPYGTEESKAPWLGFTPLVVDRRAPPF